MTRRHTDARLRASSHLRLVQGALTTVTNLTTAPVTAGLTFDQQMLGLQDPRGTMVMAAREATVGVEADANRLALEPGGLALLRIGQAASEPR